MIKSKLYNTDIDSLLRSLDLAHFKGVYSADNIPHFENTDFIFICNLSNEGEVGTHFVTIGKLGNMILYLDSLALKPGMWNILHFLCFAISRRRHRVTGGQPSALFEGNKQEVQRRYLCQEHIYFSASPQ